MKLWGTGTIKPKTVTLIQTKQSHRLEIGYLGLIQQRGRSHKALGTYGDIVVDRRLSTNKEETNKIPKLKPAKYRNRMVMIKDVLNASDESFDSLGLRVNKRSGERLHFRAASSPQRQHQIGSLQKRGVGSLLRASWIHSSPLGRNLINATLGISVGSPSDYLRLPGVSTRRLGWSRRRPLEFNGNLSDTGKLTVVPQ